MKLTTDDVVVALGESYSPIQEVERATLLIPLKNRDATQLELRIEPDWLRMFVWLSSHGAYRDELRRLLRVNEQVLVVRYGIEHDRIVLRADLPVRLWSEGEFLATIRELEQVLDGLEVGS